MSPLAARPRETIFVRCKRERDQQLVSILESSLEDSFHAPIPFYTQPMAALLVAISSIPIGKSCHVLAPHLELETSVFTETVPRELGDVQITYTI